MTETKTNPQQHYWANVMLFLSTPDALSAESAKNDRLKTDTYKNIVAFPAPKKRRHSVSRKSETTASEGRVRLDDNFVAPLPNGSDIFLWDADLPGFGLRVRQAGSKRWILRYIERGKARVWTIGDAGRMLAKTARAAARTRLGEIALVGLPKRPPRSAAKVKLTTFNQLADQFLADKPFAWKPSTEATAILRIRGHICGAFGDMHVGAIRRQDVMRWRDGMADRAGAFNRDVAVLSSVMQYAESLGLRPRGSNPTKGISRYKREPMERFLEAAEYRRLHLRLTECEDQAMASAIRLLIHTGARAGEISSLTWGEVSTDRLELRDSKTGPKVILLSRQSKAILNELPRGHQTALVFPGTKGQPANLSYFWQKFRNSAGLPDVRLHDLRHSYASIAIQNGVHLESIGRLLGHALAETTARYAHLSDGVISEAAETVGASVIQLMGMSNVAI